MCVLRIFFRVPHSRALLFVSHKSIAIKRHKIDCGKPTATSAIQNGTGRFHKVFSDNLYGVIRAFQMSRHIFWNVGSLKVTACLVICNIYPTTTLALVWGYFSMYFGPLLRT